MASKEQKEGVARVFDTLAASAVIGAVAGMAGYGAIGLRDIVLLWAAAPALLISAWFTRETAK